MELARCRQRRAYLLPEISLGELCQSPRRNRYLNRYVGLSKLYSKISWVPEILLMDEILHHLGALNYCNSQDFRDKGGARLPPSTVLGPFCHGDL